MVYCTKCGAKNEEDALVCVKCGAPLQREPRPPWRYERKRAEEECFGIPNAGPVVGLVIGLIIILVGLSLLVKIDVGPAIVIIVGILVIVAALYGLRRRY